MRLFQNKDLILCLVYSSKMLNTDRLLRLNSTVCLISLKEDTDVNKCWILIQYKWGLLMKSRYGERQCFTLWSYVLFFWVIILYCIPLLKHTYSFQRLSFKQPSPECPPTSIWRCFTMGLSWQLSQPCINPTLNCSSNLKSRSNSFLKPTGTMQWE